MAAHLTPAARSVTPSGIREIYNLAAGRDDVLHLEVGQPDFPTPAHITEAGIEAARRGVGYTQTAGILELREAIAEKLKLFDGLDYGPDQILVTQGAEEALAVLFAATLSPGDEVLLPDPGFPNFTMLAVLNDTRPVFYTGRPDDGFRPDVDEIVDKLGPNTKMLVLNSPANPTGAVIPEDDVRRIVERAAANGTLVISDEVYTQLVFEGHAVPSATFDAENVIGVYSFSKAYAMTGWRVGYIAAAPGIASAIERLQEPFISCVSGITQAGALAALRGPQDHLGTWCDAYRERRDLLVKLFADEGITVPVPGGAFYLMVPLAKGADSRRAAISLVKRGVAVAPGSAFGRVAADHLRLSLAVGEETLREAVARITRWYRETNGFAPSTP